MTSERVVRLRKSLEQRLSEGHPWVYRDALEPLEAEPGELVQVHDRRGKFVARGVAESGPIGVRVFATRDEPVDEALLTRRLHQALQLRADVVPPDTTAFRCVHGEGDRLPGIVLDEYGADVGKFAVLRLDGEAAMAWEERILSAFWPVLQERGVDGLLIRRGRRGESPRLARGVAPPLEVRVREHGMTLVANLFEGQKTGLFLDHRESRARVRALAGGRRVLNLYAYTGGFSVAAGLGGATGVVSVDVAPAAIALAQTSWRANALADVHAAHASDVREFLEAERGLFDLVIADPPSFAPNEKSVEGAERAYEQLHAACLRRLLPGGYYLAASCSSHVRAETFDATLRRGARKAGRVLQVLERWNAPADHPRLVAFPEGDYLDVLLTRSVG